MELTTTQLVATTVVALFCGHWLWKWLDERRRHRPGGGSDPSFVEPQNQHQYRSATSRSRLLRELNPLPNDLDLKEAEEVFDDDAETKETKENGSVNVAITTMTTTALSEQEEGNKENTTLEDENDVGRGNSDSAAERLALSNIETDSNFAVTETPATNEVEGDDDDDNNHDGDGQEPETAATATSTATATIPVVQFANQSNEHPGLDGFWYWCDVESSLYRIYNIGRDDGQDVVPPYIPKSRRGRVQVHVMVTNKSSRRIQAFWITYKGGEESKGILAPLVGKWEQFSWIEHPWIFRDADTGEVLLHYIPDRIIPSTALDVTTSTGPYGAAEDDHDDDKTGIHRFTFRDAIHDGKFPFLISLDDPILPFPAQQHITSIEQAVHWTVRHMLRVAESSRLPSACNWDVILKYFYNFLHHPNEPKYRRIRLANRTFSSQVWNTPARGLFLAAGFVEQGAYAELGTGGSNTATTSFPAHRIKDLSDFVLLMEQWKQQWNVFTGAAAPTVQPHGAADGLGRAGFGVAGSNEFRH
ncbi:hypothetical protein ACA910_016367 [Epithemia clementina (nom. ined.)]